MKWVRGPVSRIAEWLYVIPATAVVFTFILWPVIQGISLSFYNMVLTRPEDTRFVGLGNYVALLQDEVFVEASIHTAFFLAGATAIAVLGGLACGMFLSQEFKFNNVIRALVLLPWIFPDVIAAVLWKWMLHSEMGLVNYILTSLRILETPYPWLGSTDTALLMCTLVMAWRLFPFIALMVVASVQAINIEFYEAADIDGASRWFKFAKITLPLISPSLIVATLLIAIWVANNIPITLLLTYGGPIHSSEIWATWIYKRAFVFFDFGMGATASAMNFILLLAFSIAYVYLFRGVLTGRG